MSYEEVHQEVLRLVQEDGGMAAIEFYRQNKKIYDSAGPVVPFAGLRGKLELIGAVEEKHNLLGVSVSTWDREPIIAQDCVDYVIDFLYSALDLFDRWDDIPITQPIPSY